MTVRSGVLKHSPLTHVIASIRFAPWALLAKRIDQIHDQLREKMPLMQNIKLEVVGADNQSSGYSHEAWMMMTSDKSFGVQIAPDQILIFTSNYSSFSKFKDTLNESLDALLKEMRFMDVLNMGIRYIDHIQAKPNESIEEYISTKFLSPKLDGYESGGAHIIAEYIRNDMRLRVNAISVPNSLSVPQELLGILLMAQGPGKQLQIPALGVNDCLLDMDAILTHESTARMLKDTVVENIEKLHSFANDFFRNSEVLTDHAFNTWKGKS